MPIYEYRCVQCSHVIEALHKPSETHDGECPSCGAIELQRLISRSSFRLTGTGWYETDFKNKSTQKDTTGSVKETGQSTDTTNTAGASSEKPATSSLPEKSVRKESKPSAKETASSDYSQ